MSVSAYFLQLARRAGTLVGLSYAFILLVALPVMLLNAVGFGLFVVLLAASVQPGGLTTLGGGDRIMVLGLRGEIVGHEQSASDGSGGVDGYAVKDRLKELADDDSVKAVLLEIDSPGGSIAGARAIADGVARYREQTKRPITAYVAGSADSGAYWAAVSTDFVTADHGTDVGDIGVIIGPFPQYRGATSVTNADGTSVAGASVTESYITAGTGKDAGNPYRPLSADETANYQRSADTIYTQFVNYVAERRQLTAAVIRGQIKALAYEPETAKSLGLIDAVADRDTALAELAGRANLTADSYSVETEELATPLYDGFSGEVKKFFGAGNSAARAALAGGKRLGALASHPVLAR